MGEGNSKKRKAIKGLIIVLVLILGLAALIYYNRSGTGIPALDELIPDFGQKASTNLTDPTLLNPRNSSLRTSKAEIDSLLQKMEGYRSLLPQDILKTIDELSSDLRAMASN